MIKVALPQLSSVPQKAEMLKKQLQSIAEAAAGGAQVVCLQELCLTPYFCVQEDPELFHFADTIPGLSLDRFAEAAREHQVVLIVPFFEKRAPGIYHNTAAVFEKDGTLLGLYRKMHIPEDPGFHEKFYFTPGDLGFRVFNTSAGKLGILICWDQWFPEAARMTALAGAEILFYPTAIGWLKEEIGTPEASAMRHAWETIQQAHAVANGCFVASVNRVGEEQGTRFWGTSFVAGPYGVPTARAGESEELLITDCDLASLDQHRRIWPFFRDRRPETYAPVSKEVGP